MGMQNKRILSLLATVFLFFNLSFSQSLTDGIKWDWIVTQWKNMPKEFISDPIGFFMGVDMNSLINNPDFILYIEKDINGNIKDIVVAPYAIIETYVGMKSFIDSIKANSLKKNAYLIGNITLASAPLLIIPIPEGKISEFQKTATTMDDVFRLERKALATNERTSLHIVGRHCPKYFLAFFEDEARLSRTMIEFVEQYKNTLTKPVVSTKTHTFFLRSDVAYITQLARDVVENGRLLLIEKTLRKDAATGKIISETRYTIEGRAICDAGFERNYRIVFNDEGELITFFPTEEVPESVLAAYPEVMRAKMIHDQQYPLYKASKKKRRMTRSN